MCPSIKETSLLLFFCHNLAFSIQLLFTGQGEALCGHQTIRDQDIARLRGKGAAFGRIEPLEEQVPRLQRHCR